MANHSQLLNGHAKANTNYDSITIVLVSLRSLRAETSCIPRKTETLLYPNEKYLCVRTTNPPLSLKFVFF